MSVALSSIPEPERRTVVTRRLSGASGGIGYNAALDAAHKLKIAIPSASNNRIKRMKQVKLDKLAARQLLELAEDLDVV